MSETTNYQQTVNLPQTDFSMRANAPVREPEIQHFWAEAEIYQTLADTNPGAPFTLHDGPPYANGGLHVGHALNKILKDTINRYQMLRGRKVRYIPGWDCHGLPIELKVLQNLKTAERQNLTPLDLRHKARDFAQSTVTQQKKSFERLGVWGEWHQPYLTLLPEYEAAQIGVFGKMAEQGYIYRALKPVYWSPSSRTALAEAELEYPENHVSRSIYVAFRVKDMTTLPVELQTYGPMAVAIWTTTPWTIPGNLGICLNAEITYALVKTQTHGLLIVATALSEKFGQVIGETFTTLWTGLGQQLEGVLTEHPLYDRVSPLVLGDHVTTESGTGAVHTAPGHGADDFLVGQKYHLGLLSPVDDQGNFTAEAGELFLGKNVLGEGNTAVIAALQAVGALLKEEDYAHKYPYDWRTKKPVIVRATTQWFASVAGFRDQALAQIEQVQWLPASGQNRITAMVSERSDWCISRQRSWGLPIPVFYDDQTGEPLLNTETTAHIQKLFAEKGSDAWWELTTEELLPETYHNNGHSYRRGFDTMDVWFDSGSSWAAVLGKRIFTTETNYQADLYLEGSDQHRGWFQSSLLTSVATRGIAPYKAVLTHGFALDEQGRKMSKSLGNVLDPLLVINGGKDLKKEPAYGADVLRLWVSSVDYSTDVRLGPNILGQQADIYRKIRNTARYLLGNLYDFKPATDLITHQDLPKLEQYLLHRLYEVVRDVTDAFEQYQFFRFYQTIQNFCVVELSNFYLDIAKDSLYISAATSPRRRSVQTVLYHVLETLTRLIAPVLCHLAEDIWQNLPYTASHKSVFLAGWPDLPRAWQQPELAESWQKLAKLRTTVTVALEKERVQKVIGSSLEAKVILTGQRFPPEILQYQADLRYLFIVSQVELMPAEHTDVTITISKADGHKCPRCWNYSTHIGESSRHPEVCERCDEALEGNY